MKACHKSAAFLYTMSSFILTLSFRVTLPCAPQLLIYAETNGGKQNKKKRYSIRNLENLVSCAAV
jgi:hypothetical protein